MERGSGQYDRVGRHNSVPSTDTPNPQAYNEAISSRRNPETSWMTPIY